ncbi:BTB domain-containing protein [Trichostrongylus colubriformis]|uniref:BTB domain-containing protein n=2 Tax=Trichostrongylus colubriformis TaxID=6319 RepID=A0AAN8FQ29_TRICO
MAFFQVRLYRWAYVSSRPPLLPRSHPRRFFAVREVTKRDRGSLVTVHSSAFLWRPSMAAEERLRGEGTEKMPCVAVVLPFLAFLMWFYRSVISEHSSETVEQLKSSPATLDDSLLKPSSFSFSVRDACVAAGQVDAKVFRDGEQPATIMSHLDQFRRNENMCDVVLEVDGQSLAAHRFVLAAAIPYFRAMFGYDVVEAKMDRIILNDISFEALDALVNFVYTSEISINSDNVQSLLFAASILQMDSVCYACQRFMTQLLTTKNCLLIRQFAEQHNCVNLLNSSDDYAVDHFIELRELDEFKLIAFPHLRDLIRRSDLKITSEEQVFESVIDWVESNPCDRKNYLPELLSLVRLPQLNMQYLVDNVRQNKLIKESRECTDLVSEALFIMLSPLKGTPIPVGAALNDECGGQYAAGSTMSIPRPLSPSSQALRSRPRKSVAGVIFCAGGRGTGGDPFRSVEAFDCRLNRWISICEMTQQRRHVGVVSALGKLFAIGGHDGMQHLASAEMFDPREGVGWRRVAPMRTCRRGIAAAALDGAIYAVGGLDDTTCFSTVERYDIESNTWCDVAPMNIRRGGVGVSALGKFLFAVGGNDGSSSLDSCERYDPVLDKWKLVSKMTNRRAGAGVCVLDGALYALGGFDDNSPLCTCERYDPHTDQWTQLANMTFSRGGVGVASMGGLVYAIGGHDGQRYLNTVEAYDPVTNAWTPVTDIKDCRAGAGVAWADCSIDDLLRPFQPDSGYAPSGGNHCI